MARRAFALLCLQLAYAFGKVATYAVADPDSSPALQRLREEVESGKSGAVQEFWTSVSKTGTPLEETIPGEKDFSLVTFLWRTTKIRAMSAALTKDESSGDINGHLGKKMLLSGKTAWKGGCKGRDMASLDVTKRRYGCKGTGGRRSEP